MEEYMNKRTRKLAIKIAQLCVKKGDINSAAEACAMLAAMFCNFIAEEEGNVDPVDIFTSMCEHAYALSKRNDVDIKGLN